MNVVLLFSTIIVLFLVKYYCLISTFIIILAILGLCDPQACR